MKKSLQHRAFWARDIYSKWKRLVASAQDSITIYSPYFDGIVSSLLKAKKNIDPDKINIITDFTAESILELPRQLRTIKKMISEGISVLTLPGLHAKILLVDDKYVISGSQNFTCQGRRNKEASAAPASAMEGTPFIATLLDWRKRAEHMDEAFVDLLLSKLKNRIKQHKELHVKSKTEFDEIQEAYEEEQREALKRRLEKLEQQSSIRMANGVIYATIQNVSAETGSYNSLLSDYSHDMTKWIIRKANGHTQPYKLNRLSMYPAIFADTLRMGFARIGKTRITYIRTGLKWDKDLNVGDLNLRVEINFPETKTKKRNIVVKLSDHFRSSCEFSLLFTGDSFTNIKHRYFKGYPSWEDEHKEFIATIDNEFFGSTSALEKFFANFFTDFTYAELYRDHKNIKDYLKGWRYRLSIIQYQKNPFLVIRKQ